MTDTSKGSARPRAIVILLTYGEPGVARFSDQYGYSLLILRRLTKMVAPIPSFAMPLIAALRARRRVREWRAAGYASPLECITFDQRDALAKMLPERKSDWEWEVRTVFEFRPPLLPEVLGKIAKDPPERLMLIPMYSADSDFTDGVSRKDVKFYERKNGPMTPQPEMICKFHDDERLVDLMARFVMEKTREAGWTEDDMKKAGLILGAHGTVLKGPEGIDTGLETITKLYSNLAEKLSPHFARTSAGWLNHTLGGEWTSPDLETAVGNLVEKGIKRAVYFPFGFLADNAESELEGRVAFEAAPELEVLHLLCVNTWPPFLDYLADRILEQLNAG